MEGEIKPSFYIITYKKNYFNHYICPCVDISYMCERGLIQMKNTYWYIFVMKTTKV